MLLNSLQCKSQNSETATIIYIIQTIYLQKKNIKTVHFRICILIKFTHWWWWWHASTAAKYSRTLMLFLVKSLLEKGEEKERHKKWGHTKQGSVRLPSTLYDCWTAPVPASPGFIPCTMNDECIIWRGRHIKTATIWTKVFLALRLLTCCMSNHVALFMTEVLIRSWHVCLTATQTLRESSTWMDTDMTTFNVWVWIFPYCLFINMQLFKL